MIQGTRDRKSAVQVCPKCNGHSVGKISKTRFFCAECCIEFSFNEQGKAVSYYADPTGTMVKATYPGKAVS